MRLIQETNLQGKTVILRCDFNVPLQNGVLADDFRLLAHLETIKYLQNQKAKVVLISHSETINSLPSFKPLVLCLQQILKTKVLFLPLSFKGKIKKQITKAENGTIFLLDNLRKNKGEKACDKVFAQSIASLGDIFVQDAFSVCHRKHASVVILPKLLPAFVGFALQKELLALKKALQAPQRPFTAIIGGAKLDKLKAFPKLFDICDHIIFGGKLIAQILSVKGIIIGKPWPNEDIVKVIKQMPQTNTKIHFPMDVLVSSDPSGELYIRDCAPGQTRKEEEIYDIGKESIKAFKNIIAVSKTILWTGTLGVAETPAFSKGTEGVAFAISQNKMAFKLAGGGDTVSVIRQYGLQQGFSYLSTGGNALLNYIALGALPGIDVLN